MILNAGSGRVLRGGNDEIRTLERCDDRLVIPLYDCICVPARVSFLPFLESIHIDATVDGVVVFANIY